MFPLTVLRENPTLQKQKRLSFVPVPGASLGAEKDFSDSCLSSVTFPAQLSVLPRLPTLLETLTPPARAVSLDPYRAGEQSRISEAGCRHLMLVLALRYTEDSSLWGDVPGSEGPTSLSPAIHSLPLQKPKSLVPNSLIKQVQESS